MSASIITDNRKTYAFTPLQELPSPTKSSNERSWEIPQNEMGNFPQQDELNPNLNPLSLHSRLTAFVKERVTIKTTLTVVAGLTAMATFAYGITSGREIYMSALARAIDSLRIHLFRT